MDGAEARRDRSDCVDDRAVTVEEAEFLRGTRNQLIVFARTRPDDALSTQALHDIHDAVARLDNILAREDIEPRKASLAGWQ